MCVTFDSGFFGVWGRRTWRTLAFHGRRQCCGQLAKEVVQGLRNGCCLGDCPRSCCFSTICSRPVRSLKGSMFVVARQARLIALPSPRCSVFWAKLLPIRCCATRKCFVGCSTSETFVPCSICCVYHIFDALRTGFAGERSKSPELITMDDTV